MDSVKDPDIQKYMNNMVLSNTQKLVLIKIKRREEKFLASVNKILKDFYPENFDKDGFKAEGYEITDWVEGIMEDRPKWKTKYDLKSKKHNFERKL